MNTETEQERRQRHFDIVWKGFETQGWKKSVLSIGGCAYRGENGSKCGIGHLIPDDRYGLKLERNGVDRLLEGTIRVWDLTTNIYEYMKITPFTDIMPLEDRDFYQALQSAHDNSLDVSVSNSLKEEMIQFAKNWKLEVPSSPV
jgi:hypothetical protein